MSEEKKTKENERREDLGAPDFLHLSINFRPACSDVGFAPLLDEKRTATHPSCHGLIVCPTCASFWRELYANNVRFITLRPIARAVCQ